MMAEKYGPDKKGWPKNDVEIYTSCFGEGSRGRRLGLRAEELGLVSKPATVSTAMSMTTDLSLVQTQLEVMQQNIHHLEEVQQNIQNLQTFPDATQYITRDDLNAILENRDKERENRDKERDGRWDRTLKESNNEMKQFLKESADAITSSLSSQITRDMAATKFMLQQGLTSTLTTTLQNFELKKANEKTEKLKRKMEAGAGQWHASGGSGAGSGSGAAAGGIGAGFKARGSGDQCEGGKAKGGGCDGKGGQAVGGEAKGGKGGKGVGGEGKGKGKK